MLKIIQAGYIKNFQCDGKICKSRCCKDWKIAVDDETYEKFLQIDDAEIFENLEQENNSFVLKMTEHGLCKFLDENFLCKLQKKHGENFLTAICQSYPRITYKFDKNIFEQSMTLTCPIAAQLILLSTESINFVEVQEIKSRAIIDFTKKLLRPTENFLSVQMQAIKILQNKNFSINERLKNLCDFFYAKKFLKNNFDFESHANILIKIFNEMYDANLTNDKKKILYRDYLNNRENILNAIHENFAYILENYLVNEFFMRCYPCAFNGDDWHNCKIFVTSFRILEFSIVLTAIAKKNFTLEDFINLICSVNDKLDHSKGGMDAIKNFAEIVDDEKFFNTMI